ncbi:hypothetical protein R80B4_00977 [Fibrobacteres bacterium R8-0-B4]
MTDKPLALIVAAFGFAVTQLNTISERMLVLVILIMFDYFCGLAIPLLWRKAKPGRTARPSSRIGLKGLFKKGFMLALVLIGWHLDKALHMDFIAEGLIICFIVNELLSIVEHSRVIGLKIPVVDKVIMLLREKINNADVKDDGNHNLK